jgi:serine protease inhibitor
MQSEHDNFEPIHLSEEWLIWFGFTKNKLSMYLCLPNDNDECKPFFNKDSLSKYTQLLQSNDLLPISTFQYVHQLQNIYFALTGEELTIKN